MRRAVLDQLDGVDLTTADDTPEVLLPLARTQLYLLTSYYLLTSAPCSTNTIRTRPAGAAPARARRAAGRGRAPCG
ncbi:hypothetical protein [Saccharopolyspora sp. ASAGF58]|uniref:hypothetical protein n=1 Tax=Saccharopolyspora sp. ASAGF58 TaxID=2719023 RepID=UPI00143FD74B|nr:hypothetical protein [Saccharopolyspora sp. ASAGF58]QIZ34506.1 hypothetical protein FDZ84_06850 [Saccharopolyspora sp. ASAGF58]